MWENQHFDEKRTPWILGWDKDLTFLKHTYKNHPVIRLSLQRRNKNRTIWKERETSRLQINHRAAPPSTERHRQWTHSFRLSSVAPSLSACSMPAAVLRTPRPGPCLVITQVREFPNFLCWPCLCYLRNIFIAPMIPKKCPSVPFMP